MRLLADENFPRLVVQELRSRGHDVMWVNEERPGVSDSDVLTFATIDKRLLITFDKEDFGELIFKNKRKAPFGIILFRLPENTPERTQTIITELESRADWAGHFSTIDKNGLRRRRLPNS